MADPGALNSRLLYLNRAAINSPAMPLATWQGQASFSGDGTATANFYQLCGGRAVFAGMSAFVAGSSVLRGGRATFVGTGNLAVIGLLGSYVDSIAAINSRRHTLNSTAINARWAKAEVGVTGSLSSAGALFADAQHIQPANTAFAGTGALVARGVQTLAIRASFLGAGGVATAVDPQAEASLFGAGTLHAKATLIATSYQTQFWGSGFLRALTQDHVDLRGAGMLVANANLVARFQAHPGGNVVALHAGGGGLSAHGTNSSIDEHAAPGTTIRHQDGEQLLRHAA